MCPAQGQSHIAINPPSLSDGGIPLHFVIVKTSASNTVDGARDRRSHAVTCCPPQPTHNPSQEEKLSVELQDGQTHGSRCLANTSK
ncbi:hypothetical protein G5714_024374 [Onychostoma macrolepis]|uniref:Uncharacterized protein n=1 Tax=Onychostoma macrolepis TaxID=369639 RepID=A0A7J6BK38_9TELE|nr:hypothetical protein G5714_024374 [Onychostoma macrolepis]